jgi:hypothetical protein
MRYIIQEPTSENDKKDILLDIAVSSLIGSIDTDILSANDPHFATTLSGIAEYLQLVTTIETDVIALNGVSDARKKILQKDSDDLYRTIYTESKAKKGNLIFIFESGQSPDEGDFDTINEHHQTELISSLEAITNDWSVAMVGFYNDRDVDGNSNPNFKLSNYNYVGFGVLKETQTEDFNPLDSITQPYIMVNPEYIDTLRVLKEQTNTSALNAKAQIDARQSLASKTEVL